MFDEGMTPLEFEQWVAAGLAKSGWRTRTVGGTGDQGADVIAGRDRLTAVIQCKLYSSPVGNKAVQEAAQRRRTPFSSVAAVVTNGGFTPSSAAARCYRVLLLLHSEIECFEEMLSTIQPDCEPALFGACPGPVPFTFSLPGSGRLKSPSEQIQDFSSDGRPSMESQAHRASLGADAPRQLPLALDILERVALVLFYSFMSWSFLTSWSKTGSLATLIVLALKRLFLQQFLSGAGPATSPSTRQTGCWPLLGPFFRCWSALWRTVAWSRFMHAPIMLIARRKSQPGNPST